MDIDERKNVNSKNENLNSLMTLNTYLTLETITDESNIDYHKNNNLIILSNIFSIESNGLNSNYLSKPLSIENIKNYQATVIINALIQIISASLSLNEIKVYEAFSSIIINDNNIDISNIDVIKDIISTTALNNNVSVPESDIIVTADIIKNAYDDIKTIDIRETYKTPNHPGTV